MSRPNQRPPAQTAALSAAMAGAVDLSALKARSEAAASPQAPAAAGGGGGASRFVLDVTEQSFQADVLERSMQIPVIVDLWATWCQPCKQLSPVLERLAEAERGAGAPEQVEEPEPDDPRFTAAEDALECGDYAEAEAAYQRILDVEPANEQATAALAQVRFLARAENADPTAVDRADAAPDDVDLQLLAADADLAGDRVEAAFTRLVDTVARMSGDERDRVREHLVGLFELFTPDDPRVTAARRSLARALF